MKRTILVLILTSLFSFVCGQEKDFLSNVYQYIENTQVYELGQEEGHVPLANFVSTGLTEKVRSLKDGSGNDIQVNVMGRAKLVRGVNGNGMDLNGHDEIRIRPSEGLWDASAYRFVRCEIERA